MFSRYINNTVYFKNQETKDEHYLKHNTSVTILSSYLDNLAKSGIMCIVLDEQTKLHHVVCASVLSKEKTIE